MRFRLSPREKNSISAFLSILIALITLLTMLFPEFIDYKYSISKLSEKNDAIETATSSLLSNERAIENLKTDILNKKLNADKAKAIADELRSRVDARSFDLHVPSLLITLEESARNQEIDITIEYGEMTNNSGDFSQVVNVEYPNDSSPNPTEDTDEQNPQDLQSPDNEENNKNGPQVPNNSNKPSDRTSQRPSAPNVIGNQGSDGMSVASVPIKIEGDFLKIRDFALILDQIDFVEPVYIEIDSEGQSVKASMLLNIYHGEVK